MDFEEKGLQFTIMAEILPDNKKTRELKRKREADEAAIRAKEEEVKERVNEPCL